MKIHGSIEATALRTKPPKKLPNFHEWKFMAPLKLLYWSLLCPLYGHFHEWKFMAPLKRNRFDGICNLQIEFPWMKIHGSIEAKIENAPDFNPDLISMNENSWLHWSMVSPLRDTHWISISMNENSWLHWSFTVWTVNLCHFRFPWMKIHGSIEAADGMDDDEIILNFHEWKFMAPLKLLMEWMMTK